jgi:hypothetical protein
MLAYLFDTSAIASFYVPKDANHNPAKVFERIRKQREDLGCVLYVPNICIPEVLNTLAKFRFEAKPDGPRLNPSQYKQTLERFRHDVHWGRLFYPYDLTRYHVIAADEIIPFEYEVSREGRPNRDKKYDRLNTFDILIIAMASELAFVWGVQRITLVTGDSRIKRVCEAMRACSFKERQRRRVWGVLGPIPPERWPVPLVFDVHRDPPEKLPVPVHGKPLREMRA